MFIQTESKAQGWRAVAILEGRGECLLYVGRSSTHVRGEYLEAYAELLEDDEKEACTAIHLQQWQGTPDAGRWQTKNELRVPERAKLARVA
ncbi:hypothetical protein [Limnoglobus roseus]|uniref:Uncharacterized protein n=1 Tax=Limnoglobus roseus TaxID=2598579 RepID=A0A5C1A8Y6_9BACT|nr:hypothetical protein [Limnoglobus roseus]QEL14506.1 hypothetical protein PX52LOC_01396 [Limnoglobus roseus]